MQDFEVISVISNVTGAWWREDVRVGVKLDGNSVLGLNITESATVGFSWISVKEIQTGILL